MQSRGDLTEENQIGYKSEVSLIWSVVCGANSHTSAITDKHQELQQYDLR